MKLPDLKRMDAFLDALKALEDEHEIHIGVPSFGMTLIDGRRSASPLGSYRWIEEKQRYGLLSQSGELGANPNVMDELFQAVGRSYLFLLQARGEIGGPAKAVDDQTRKQAIKDAEDWLAERLRQLILGLTQERIPRTEIKEAIEKEQAALEAQAGGSDEGE